MGKSRLKKEKWTLTFDSRLKAAVVEEARRQGVYPVAILESMVRERLNPFGHIDVKDEEPYVRRLRRKNERQNEKEFLEAIRRWQRMSS